MPIIQIDDGTEFLPLIQVEKDYKEQVKIFYRQGHKKTVEKYIKKIEQEYPGIGEIRTRWGQSGLETLAIGPDCAIDLDKQHLGYIFHNIENPKDQKPLIEILKVYITLLEKQNK